MRNIVLIDLVLLLENKNLLFVNQKKVEQLNVNKQ